MKLQIVLAVAGVIMFGGLLAGAGNSWAHDVPQIPEGNPLVTRTIHVDEEVLFLARTVGYAISGILTPLFFWIVLRKPQRSVSARALALRRRWAPWVVGAFYISTMGAVWDAWWHFGVGRDNFWIPPHLMAHLPLIFTGAVATLTWLKVRDKIWIRLLIAQFALLFSVILDDRIWHEYFGDELLTEIWIAWSPPHTFLIAMFGLISIVLGNILFTSQQKKTIPYTQLFGPLLFASMAVYLIFEVLPLIPISQWQYPWAIAGYWGAAAETFVIALLFISSQLWVPGKGITFRTAAFFFLAHAMQFGQEAGEGILTFPHDNPPISMTALAFAASAVAVDFLKKQHPAVRGAALGLVFSGIIYGSSWYFFEPQFQYTVTDALVAVSSATIGGLAGGAVAFFAKSKNFFNRL